MPHRRAGEALAVHAYADLEPVHQIGIHRFQHNGANPVRDLIAILQFQDQAIYAFGAQQLAD